MKLLIILSVLGLTNGIPKDYRNVEFPEFPTTIEMIKANGYPAESHVVETDDGYLLTMHRIPYGLKSENFNETKGTVFLQHDLLSSSADWVVIGPENGLAYLLADAGYDVWMGNARGNKYSRNHKTLDPNGPLFWDFSWHEIGIYDLPIMIKYVSAEVGRKIHYVGHGQGSTSVFAMLSILPEHNDKLLSVNALAPLAFMSHLKNPLLQLIAPLTNELGLIASLLGPHEFAPSTEMMQKGGYLACMEDSPIKEVCPNAMFLIFGFDSQQMNRTQIPAILANVPAGAATKQLTHYGQLVNSGRFALFDYDVIIDNVFKYGTFTPPEYPLGEITAPIALYYASNDWLVAIEDVDILSEGLYNANSITKYLVPFEKFNHADFLWAIDVKSLLYDKVIAIIEKFN